VGAVAEQLIHHRLMGAPVLDGERRLVGFITEQDCIRQALNDSYYGDDHQVAGDIMRRDVVFISPDVAIVELAQDMLNRRPKMYPVCEGGRVLGMITRTDVLRALSEARLASRKKG